MSGTDHIRRASEAFDRRDWPLAHREYASADSVESLSGDDLQRYAHAAYLLGREEESRVLLERSHRVHLEAGQPQGAARDSFWLALTSLSRGDVAQANAWIARGERLVDQLDCAERGYLTLLVVEQMLHGGDIAAARQKALAVIELGERHGDLDLVAAARHVQGRAAIRSGELAPGLKLLDETMLAVVGGKLTALMTGLMYCSVIAACHEICEYGRAREWTTSLSRWCERQSGMVAFTDTCLVHRAEILQLQGAWPDALREVLRVCERCEQHDRRPPGAALYLRGEIHRLHGELANAEAAYRAASACGFEPQPGLAMLRLAQGCTDAAAATLRRLVSVTVGPLQRARLLPAYVEIMLAVDDFGEAQLASEEITSLGAAFGTEALQARAAEARGCVARRRGELATALKEFRQAFEGWDRLGAPFEAARVRVWTGELCRELGDAEASTLEFDAARSAFKKLGALEELARLEATCPRSRQPGPLTARELDVLRMIASGQSNKGIAGVLQLSERAIDRQVSSILGKLGVPTRAAATAYAYTQRLFDAAGGNYPSNPAHP